jgi:4-diphosphocytidyl-2-C-methyl-D-erythritol kinase
MTHVLLAPGKINLTLEVLARRDDGYHGVRSVMVPISLADRVSIEPADRFSFVCNRQELATDSNLVVRALRALGKLPSARIELDKHLPAQAGLGGGSTDAAAILRAAMEGVLSAPAGIDWLRTARALGSDVPFFLAGTAALVEGTGERVTPAGALPAWCLAVVKPPVGTSTAAAYERLDASPRPSRARSQSVSLEMVEALQRANFERVEALLQNDFHDVAMASVPEVALAVHALRAAGARRPLLAGSGSCVFALASGREERDAILQRLALPSTFQRWPAEFAATPQWRNAVA